MSTRSRQEPDRSARCGSFLGLEGDFGKGLGVDNDWAYRIVKAEGNYGEVYEATFGSKGLACRAG